LNGTQSRKKEGDGFACGVVRPFPGGKACEIFSTPSKAYKTAYYMPITHISIDFLPFHDYDIHERQEIDSWRK